MTAKGAKRAAKAGPDAEAKRPRADPHLAGVVEAVGQAELPEACRALLAAVAPRCFETPAGQRHEHQDTVMSWIGDVLDSVRGNLQAVVTEADAEASEADKAKDDLAVRVSEAKAALTAARELIAAKEAALSVALQGEISAKAKLSVAEAARSHADLRAHELKTEKQGLETALKEDIQFLRQEDCFEASQAEQHAASLIPLAEKMGMDTSLLLVLPKACAKRPSERGQLDAAVFDQVEAGIAGKVKELEVALEAGAAAAEQAASALEEGRSDIVDAEQAKQAAAAEINVARAQESQAAAVVGKAEAAVMAFVRSRAPAEEARKKKAVALQNFTDYNMECFQTLRDRVACGGA